MSHTSVRGVFGENCLRRSSAHPLTHMRLVQTSCNVVMSCSSVAMSGFGPASARNLSSGPASGGSEAWRQNLITDSQDIVKVIPVNTAMANQARG